MAIAKNPRRGTTHTQQADAEKAAEAFIAGAGGLPEQAVVHKTPVMIRFDRGLSDGRWYDPARQTWRDRQGRIARWPDLEQMARLRTTRVVLAAAHLDHDPTTDY